MWKRFQLGNRARDQAIGDPVLVNSTFDEKILGQLPHVAEIHHGHAAGAELAFGRRGNADVLRQLPPPPWNGGITSEVARVRPYFDSFDSSPHFPPQHLVEDYPGDPNSPSAVSISSHFRPSPPHTPSRNFSRRSPYSEDDNSISPINSSTQSSPLTSPVIDPDLRRSKFHSGVSTLGQGPPTYNGFTALGISEHAEKPEARFSLDQEEMKEPGGSSRTPSLQAVEAVQKWIKARTKLRDLTEPSIYTIERANDDQGDIEAAASDRKHTARRTVSASAALQKPLPATKPLTIPPRSTRRPSPPLSAISEASTTTLTPNIAKAEPSSEPPTASDEDEDQVKPTVPLKVGRNSPPRIYASLNRSGKRTVSPSSPMEGSSSTSSPISSDGFWNKPLPTPMHGLLDSRLSESPVDTNEQNFRSAMQETNFQPHMVSRFSATTYASTLETQSLPTSPVIPSPTILSSPVLQSSIMERSRPLPSSVTANSRATTRKPAPSQVPKNIEESITVNKQRRNSKSLPQSPPEKESVDRITRLQAQLDGLRYRRENIQKIIHDWTNSVPADIIPASRKELKSNIDRLKTELAEISLEEHEVGIKLHRAWKRRDDSEQAEPTSLWIRRVTS